MYEHHHRRLLAWPQFVRRALRHLLWAAVILGAGVTIGTEGYHALGGLPWVDAFLNASMILGGMGPVDRLTTTGAKIFSAIYALFSGVVFIGVMGVVIAPWAHRLLHVIHVEDR